MNPIEIAHSAHLQALRSLRVLKDRELHIQELIKEKNYAEIVKEKRNYQKIVASLKELIQHLKEQYDGFDMEKRTSEEGQTLRRLFLNTANLDETLMP